MSVKESLLKYNKYSTIYGEYTPLVGYMENRNPKLTYNEDERAFALSYDEKKHLEDFGVVFSPSSWKQYSLLIIDEGSTLEEALNSWDTLEGDVLPTHFVYVSNNQRDVDNMIDYVAEKLPSCKTLNARSSSKFYDEFYNVKNKLDVTPYVVRLYTQGPEDIGQDFVELYKGILVEIGKVHKGYRFVSCSATHLSGIFEELAVDLYLLYGLIPLTKTLNGIRDKLVRCTYNPTLPVYDLVKQMERFPVITTSVGKKVNHINILSDWNLTFDVVCVCIDFMDEPDSRIETFKVDAKTMSIKNIFDPADIKGLDMCKDIESSDFIKERLEEFSKRLTGEHIDGVLSVFNVVLFSMYDLDWIGYVDRNRINLDLTCQVMVNGLGSRVRHFGLNDIRHLIPLDLDYRQRKLYTALASKLDVKDNRPRYVHKFAYAYLDSSASGKDWRDYPTADYLSLNLYHRESVRTRNNKELIRHLGAEVFFRECDIFGGFSPVKHGNFII